MVEDMQAHPWLQAHPLTDLTGNHDLKLRRNGYGIHIDMVNVSRFSIDATSACWLDEKGGIESREPSKWGGERKSLRSGAPEGGTASWRKWRQSGKLEIGKWK
jgi:hypothetical protein